MDHLLFGTEWKTVSGDPGSLDGYMSVFGNVDLGGDVVVPGAFKKTFADWNRAKNPMALIDGHQLTGDGVIGSVTHMAEDGVGARIQAKFSSIPKAQEIRTKMIEGHLRGLSFTYDPIVFDFGRQDGKQVRFLREVRVHEATVTPVPMNQLASASAKASDPKKPYGDVTYADPGYQSDGKKRYPLDTEAHCRAAWSYINQSDNASKYSSDHLALIKGRIRAALKKYGADVQAASIDFAEFILSAKSLLDVPVPSVQRAAWDLLIPLYPYDDQEKAAAEFADGQPTADAAADTDNKSADGTAAADAYALGFVKHSEPPDGALRNPVARLDAARDTADLDRQEAEILKKLGRN